MDKNLSRLTNGMRVLVVAFALLITACSSYDVRIGKQTVEPDLTPNSDYDGLRAVPGLPWYEVSQGWNAELRRAFWFTPQGSALIPYDWFLHLEIAERSCKGRTDSTLNPGNWSRFRDPSHLASIGYIPAPADPLWNPDGLPIGFAKTPTPDGDFMGPTCSACHSNLLNLNGRKVLIEGAPTLSDLRALNVGLADALCSMDPITVKKEEGEAAFRAAKAQFDRFAKRILGEVHSIEEANRLMSKVRLQRLRIQLRNARNYSPSFPDYGRGRLDALGAILNEVTVTHAEVPQNFYPANAPVSYPFLWGISQSNVVQWNGAVHNQDDGGGALGRNVGEVVGVYGHIEFIPTGKGIEFDKKYDELEVLDKYLKRLTKKLPDGVPANVPTRAPKLLGPLGKGQLGGYKSSVMMKNLGSIEHWLSRLRSPKWPQSIYALDDNLIERGRAIYLGKTEQETQVNCSSCHQYVAREQQDQPYQANMIRVPEIGTDPVAAGNFILEARPRNNQTVLSGDTQTVRRWKTGTFEGTRKDIIRGERYGKYFQYRGEALSTTVKGVIAGELFWDGLIGKKRSDTKTEATKYINPADALFRYKARPLTGIWATAPFLHNGSVPSLREMLTPQEQRIAKFCVGSRNFVAADVGFEYQPKGDNCPDGHSLLDTSAYANSNQGHSTVRHGVKLSARDKDALIEFLKTL
ncbi:di-heme-cytochrome C peroxidase [Motiliproteus sp.]|uniref:di-heme-cytochrome C peroxidase n=1 Tax=Motiliproteus sp. TaxID=1898955 RepID=UPI003BA85C24